MKYLKQSLPFIKPMITTLLLASFTGVLGFLSAIFIPITGALALTGYITYKQAVIILITLSISRSIMRYIEQTCNHYLAFKVLAKLREIIFEKLCTLAPAKLETKDKSSIVTMLTYDIELLEIFFAHTLSPIIIAIIVSIIMLIFLGMFNIYIMLMVLLGYIFVGVIIPIIVMNSGTNNGKEYREQNTYLSSQILGAINGLEEVKQYNFGNNIINNIKEQSQVMSKLFKKVKEIEGNTQILIQSGLLFTAITVLLIGMLQGLSINVLIVVITTSLSSFGPVIALANVANNLNMTKASADRIIELLEELPQVNEVNEGIKPNEDIITLNDISFGYNELILKELSKTFKPNRITLLYGQSGIGKSTLLRLLMRFWDVNSGTITIGNTNIKDIDTKWLRHKISLVTQDTMIFSGSLRYNIQLNNDIDDERLYKACEQAALLDFVANLTDGFDTNLETLGNDISAGEKQRIGLARALYHNSDIILLDEPTSNLDSLNEGIVLNALKKLKETKTLIIVSHRKTTQEVADEILDLENH